MLAGLYKHFGKLHEIPETPFMFMHGIYVCIYVIIFERCVCANARECVKISVSFFIIIRLMTRRKKPFKVNDDSHPFASKTIFPCLIYENIDRIDNFYSFFFFFCTRLAR